MQHGLSLDMENKLRAIKTGFIFHTPLCLKSLHGGGLADLSRNRKIVVTQSVSILFCLDIK